jgi:hypothetical protein
MPDTSRRDVLTGAAALAAAGAVALPVSVPAQAALGGWRPHPSAADLRELGFRIGPSRVIMDCGLIPQAIDALDDYQRFDTAEERGLIRQLQEALYSRPRLHPLRDGPGTDI